MSEYITIRTEERFSASHFVHTAEEDSPCRRLHGHEWRVEVTITGLIQKDGMVIDFRKIKEEIKKLDHKVLIPSCLLERNDLESTNVDFSHNGKRYSIPREDCWIIRVESTTAENLAQYFATLIGLGGRELEEFEKVIVRVYESEKSYAEVTI